MLIPIGLDSARLARWPWISTAIVVLCVLAFLGTSLSDADERAEQAGRAAVRYLRERPYLKIPAALERRLGRERDDGPASPPPGASAGEIAREQARLEALALAWAAAEDATPLRRFSLVPARGAFQPGWITYQFLHGGLGHLVGNLLVFVLLVGPFLEDAWGRRFFAAFYLAGGVVAALAQVPGMDPQVPLLGASGAISACLGAFSLRFAHRRVRMLFTAFYFLYRRQLFVPAWLYAGCLFALDLLGFGLSRGRGGVAYAAHVGGFLFGVAVAVAVRATGLEERIAPEGAVRWRGGLELNRVAEALAGGDVYGARARLQGLLQKRPDDRKVRLELARLEARGLDAAAVTELVEPLVAGLIGAGDAAGAQGVLSEFRGKLRAESFRPVAAYRAAELVEQSDPLFAQALYEVAGAAGGRLGLKALLRAAQRLSVRAPERARELLGRARDLAPDAEAQAQVEKLRAALPPPPRDQISLDLSPEGEPLHELRCHLAAVHGPALDLVRPDGRTARLEPARVAQVSAAALERLTWNGQERRNGAVLDLLLHPGSDGRQALLRLALHELPLARHFPGQPPAAAYAQLVEAVRAAAGASAWPDPAGAQGRPFARFPDLGSYERACFGRVVSGVAPGRLGR